MIFKVCMKMFLNTVWFYKSEFLKIWLLTIGKTTPLYLTFAKNQEQKGRLDGT